MGRIAQGMEDILDMHVTMKIQVLQPYNSFDKRVYNRYINMPPEFTITDYGVVINLEF